MDDNIKNVIDRSLLELDLIVIHSSRISTKAYEYLY